MQKAFQELQTSHPQPASNLNMFYLVHTSVLHIGKTVFFIFSWLLFKNLGLELRGGLDLKGGSVYCRRRQKRRPGPLNKGQSEAVSCASGRPHLGPGATPGASHSFLPGAQCPIFPLPAWSPRRGKATGASSWSLNFTIPGLRGLPDPCPSLGFPFLIYKMDLQPSLPNFQPSHPTFWSSFGHPSFPTCLAVHQWVGT